MNYNQGFNVPSTTIVNYESRLRKGMSTYFCEQDFIEIISFYEESDRIEDALTALDQALDFHAFSIDFYILKCSMLLELFKPSRALDCIERSKSLGFEQADIYILEAECYKLLGNMDQALSSVSRAKVIEHGTSLAEVYFCEASIYDHFQLYNGCFESLRQTLLCDPFFKSALNKIWWCTELTGRFEDSIQLHEQILDVDAYNAQAWWNLGQAYSCIDENKKSIEAFEYATIANPKFEFAYRDLAEAYITEEQYYKALCCYYDVMEFVRPDADILSKCGYCHSKLKEFKRSRDFYLRAIKMDPYNDSALFGFSALAYQLGNFIDAKKSLKRAIKLCSEKEEYFLLKAAIELELDRPEKAASAFEKAINLAPDNELCWMKYCYYQLLESNFEKALEIMEEASEYHQSAPILTARLLSMFASGRIQAANENFFELLGSDLFDEAIFYALKPEEMHDHIAEYIK